MTLLALFCAAVAAALAVPAPRRPVPARARSPQVPGWLRPRAGALPSRTRWVLGGCLGLVAYLLIEPSGPVPALLAATPVAIGAAVGLGRLEPPGVQRARERRVLDLPEALDLLAGALGAGLPLRRAVREVAAVLPGPVGEDLGLVVSLIDVGAGDRRAWSALADRPGWDGIARDIARAADTGTGLHGALQRHAERARRNAQARRQESARTTGVRSVLPLMVCFLPAFLCIGIVPTVGSMVGRVLALE